jgi:hypothetical protein
MENYSSVSQCLTDWEFCPFCKKRNHIGIDFYDLHSDYKITTLTNTHIIYDEPPQYSINLKDNTIFLDNVRLPPVLSINCKKFHWKLTYMIKGDGSIYLKPRRMSFYIFDKKTKDLYNVKFYIADNKTNIQISNNGSNCSFEHELISFTQFNEKAIIKKIKALCLLS